MSRSNAASSPGSTKITITTEKIAPRPSSSPSWASSWLVETAPISSPTTVSTLPEVRMDTVTPDTVRTTAVFRSMRSRFSRYRSVSRMA